MTLRCFRLRAPRTAHNPIWLTVVVAFSLTCVHGLQPSAAERPALDLRAGKTAYEQSCARCHGVDGRGDGVDAKRFYPRPRDLTMGIYKFRSTVGGTPASDEDIFRTITDGLPGSNMPDWQHLDEATRWQLVYYLKSLSPVFEQALSEPLILSADPGPARANPTKGKEVYTQMGCAACHGAGGRANGASAAGLVDDWGKAIRPANLTHGWNYRGGSAPRDIITRLMAGIDGAGMPSYAEAVSSEDAWQLAYYVASLQEPPHWNLVARAVRLNGALPDMVNDPRWAAVPRTDMHVRNVVDGSGEWVQPATTVSVGLQAVYNGDTVAFRLTWDDPSHDPQAPSDALALVLKPEGVRGDTVSLQAWPYAGSPRLDLCVWSAAEGTAREAVAADFTVGAALDAAHPSRASSAQYEDGRWQLVLQRPARPASPEGAAAITADGFASLAVAVWDGGNPSARAVSPWIDAAFSDGSTTAHHE